MFEIYYTSAPEGLKRGSSGFCTVAATEGIPKPVLERLEALSGYRHHFAQGQGQTNPVSHAHWRLSAGGKEYHVLSRVCDSGVDHTHRTNAFAHHIALDAGELPGAGPAAMLADKRVMSASWDGRVGAIARAALPMVHEPSPQPCNTWAKLADNPGYAGLLLEAAIKTPNKPVCVLFLPGQPILPLIEEVMALLPAPIRWAMTFNSYFTSMPSSAICNWRFCVAKTPAADAAARAAASGGIILNLADSSKLPALPQNQFTAAAKMGTPLQAAASTATTARAVAKKPAKVETKPAPQEEIQLRDEVDVAVDNFGAASKMPVEESSAPIDLGFDPREQPVPSLERPAMMEDQAQGYMSSSRTAPIRNVEKLLHHDNSEAARNQRRRRNQLILMACLGLVAIGVVGALVVMAMRGGDIPQAPSVNRPRPNEMPVEPVPEPTPEPQVVVQPETKPAETKPVLAETKPVETKPAIPVPVRAARVILTPVQLDDPRNKIDISKISASTEYAQLFQFSGDDADDLRRTASLALLFPGDTLDYKYETPTFSGSFIGEVNTANKNPSIIISWKDKLALGAPVKICIMTYLKSQNQLQVIWPSGVTTRYTEIVSTAYWILTQSTLLSVDASGNKEKGQKVAFRPFVVPVVTLDSDTAVAFKPPAEFPPGSQAALSANLPKGWTASMFTEWESKDPSQQTPDNMLWTAKFRFATSSPAIDAFFAVSVRPKISGFSTNYFTRTATDAADLAAAQKELDAISAEMENIQDLATPELERRQKNLDLYEAKRKNYKAEGLTEAQAEEYLRLAKLGLADTQKKLNEKLAPYLARKTEKEAVVAPQREAMEAYKNLEAIEFAVKLPNGLQVFTVRIKKK